MECEEANLKGFIAAYRQEYAVTLTPEEAREELSRLVELFRLAYMAAVPQLRGAKGKPPGTR